jgi:hypothetical protein
MVTLLELGSNEVCSTETRTHAMNILRSLFRNSQLGEMVSPYVPQGFSVAIEGFTSQTWSVSIFQLVFWVILIWKLLF